VYMKPGKDKEYYTEYVNFAAALGRGQEAPELPFEPELVMFNADNSDDSIKNLRAHVVNTIKGANNYEGSKIKAQIESVRGGSQTNDSSAEDNKPAEKEKPAPVKTAAKPKATKPKAEKPVEKPAPAQDYDSFDDDIPF
ncbi:hypothetical protein, partial [Escherichia coli]|uniref:hypothetical protein n=1 Tax=Escherichia coli TaxID=562 RepID=UPI001BE4637B